MTSHDFGSLLTFNVTIEHYNHCTFNCRMENNDNLMKIHKEILDQKSKMERAEREMKSSRKDVIHNLNDQEFLTNFDVRASLSYILN